MDLHVVAVLDGATGAGVQAAEFRILFSPASAQSSYLFWQWAPDPNANVSIGTPIDPSPNNPNDPYGVDIAFPVCQGAIPGDRVHLGMISTVNLGAGQPADLLTTRRLPPTSPNRDCPMMVLCNPPVFTSVCLTVETSELPPGEEPISFRSSLNKPCTEPLCGRVDVAPSTWTAVRGLYR